MAEHGILKQPKASDFTEKVVNYKWVIARPNLFEDSRQKFSPELISISGDERSWRFKFYPRGRKPDNPISCHQPAIRVFSVKGIYKDKDYMARVEILNSEGFVMNDYRIISGNRGNIIKLPHKEELLRLTHHNRRHIKDKLILKCQIFVRARSSYHQVDDDLIRFYETKELMTCVTLCCHGKEVKAHRDILARSPIFKEMFANNMFEAKSNFIKIDDIDMETLEELLEFLYSGTSSISNYKLECLSTGQKITREVRALKLLKAANAYQLDGLKNICASVLTDCITVDGALETLIVAELFNLSQLKEEALEFIDGHLEGEMIGSYRWTEFEKKHQNLAIEATLYRVSQTI